MSDIKAVLTSDTTIKAVMNQDTGRNVKAVLKEGQSLKATLNNGVSIYNRVTGGTYIHFDVIATGNNQTFTHPDLSQYADVTQINVMRNGVNIEPSLFVKVDPTTIQFNIFLFDGDTIDILATGSAVRNIAAGNNYEVQYNMDDVLASSSNFTYSSNVLYVPTVSGNLVGNVQGNVFGNVQGNLSGNVEGNLSGNATFSSTNNIRIGGGQSGYFLKTDGLGQLSFAPAITYPAGSTSQIQFNDGTSFGASDKLTFSDNTLTVTGNIVATNISGEGSGLANINASNVVGTVSSAETVTSSSQPNITALGTLTNLFVEGVVNLGDLYNVYISGGQPGYVLTTDGQSNLTWTPQSGGSSNQISSGTSNVSIPTSNGNVTISVNGTANVMTVSSSQVSINKTTSIQQAKEKVTINNTGANGTINYDVLNGAIVMQTQVATGSITLNIRGSSATTFNSITNVGESTSISFINKNGATAYYVTTVKIDNVTVTPVWLNGVVPGTTASSLYDVYSFNILKTSNGTYVVFGSIGGYI